MNEAAMKTIDVTTRVNGTTYTRAVEPRLLLSDFLSLESCQVTSRAKDGQHEETCTTPALW